LEWEKNNYFLSSDVLGFIEYTDNAIYIDNENFVMINKNQIQILDFNGDKVKYETTKVSKEFAMHTKVTMHIIH